ncbi:hypothetical protein HY605_03445 [Candidatus Peregrinibacteria bacterium]|nr:hypothetical protein [Candidatus Peregrinibacteria bacterium]
MKNNRLTNKKIFRKVLILGYIFLMLCAFLVPGLCSSPTVTVEMIKVYDTRLPILLETDLKEVFGEAERIIRIKFGDDIRINFHDNGVMTGEQFFNGIKYKGNPIYKYYSKYKYPLQGTPLFDKEKEQIIEFLKKWKLDDLAGFFPGMAVISYEDAYRLTVEAYAGRIQHLKNIRLGTGSPLLFPDNRPYQSYVDWLGIMNEQDKYDVIVTNTLIVYDLYIQPYLHTVTLHAKVGGGAFESPKRKTLDGTSVLMNILSEYGNIKEFSGEELPVDRSTKNKILGGFVFAHEFGHTFYLIPDVYDHGDACLMNGSFENSPHDQGYRLLIKSHLPCTQCIPYVTAKRNVLLAHSAYEKGSFLEAGFYYLRAAELTPMKLAPDRNLYLKKLYGYAQKSYGKAGQKEKVKHIIELIKALKS